MELGSLLTCFLGCFTAERIIENAAAGFFHEPGAGAYEAVREHLGDLLHHEGRPINHDLLRAVRRAYLQATIELCDEASKSAVSPPPKLRQKHTRRVANNEMRHIQQVCASLRAELSRVDRDDYHYPNSPADTRVPLLLQPSDAKSDVATLKTALQDALRAELNHQHAGVPPRVDELLRNGWEASGAHGKHAREDWFQLLCAFFVYELKHNQAVAIIFQSEILASLSVQGKPVKAEDIITALTNAVGFVLTRIETLADENRQLHDITQTEIRSAQNEAGERHKELTTRFDEVQTRLGETETRIIAAMDQSAQSKSVQAIDASFNVASKLIDTVLSDICRQTVIPQTLLVVEDRPWFVSAYTNILQEEGYKVLFAYSMEEALLALEAGDVGAMLLDMMLPRERMETQLNRGIGAIGQEPSADMMSGIDLYCAVAKKFPSMRIIILSVLSEREIRERAPNVEFSCTFLQKGLHDPLTVYRTLLGVLRTPI